MFSGFAKFGAALLGCAMVCHPAAAQGPAPTKDPIKLGVIEDMSGVFSSITGIGAVTAGRMAVEEFGGSVLGRPIELVYADHENKPDVASAIARRWFDREGVVAILDVASSAPALAVLGVAKERKKVIALSSPGSLLITNEECGPYVAHWSYDTYAIAHGTGQALVAKGYDTWFFITADYAFGHNLEKQTSEFVIASGGKVLGAIRQPVPTSDFASVLLQAMASKAKVVALANAGNDTTNAIKQGFEFGMGSSGQQITALAAMINDVNSVGLQQAQGLILTEASYWDMNDKTRAWSRRYFERVKAMPNMLQVGVYSAVLHYLKAVQAAGSTDSDAVIAKMRELPVNDAFYTSANLRADGRLVHDMYVFQVKTREESKAPWDYYKLIATIPAEQAFQPLSLSKCSLVTK